MKTINLIVRQTEISRLFPHELKFQLDDNATTIDVIKAMDEKINKTCGKFPVKEFESLLQMIYHPYEERFYKQVAIQAYVKSKPFMNIRENLKMSLPDNTTIIWIPQGGCTTDWEQPVK
jgi:hypothetical protein